VYKYKKGLNIHMAKSKCKIIQPRITDMRMEVKTNTQVEQCTEHSTDWKKLEEDVENILGTSSGPVEKKLKTMTS